VNFYLSNLDNPTKYTNEDRIKIFKEVFDTDLTDMKITQVFKPLNEGIDKMYRTQTDQSIPIE
jgi:hypothetical protein